MTMQFKKATKTQSRARIALTGVAGSGKTYTALRIAKGLAPTGRVAVVDTERGSAAKYSDEFAFDTLELESFDPHLYIEAIEAAGRAGYDVLIIDSLSHAWSGKDGILEQVDNAAARARGNKFAGWKDASPLQQRLVDSILQSPCHIVATMRARTEWSLEEDERGKKVPRRIGMAPQQREGMDFEFDFLGELDLDHNCVITKTRMRKFDRAVFKPADEKVGEAVRAWLLDGAPAAESPKHEEPPIPGNVGHERFPRQPADPNAPTVEDLVANATTIEELTALVPAIKALPQARQTALRDAYGERRKALQNGGVQ